MLAEWGSIVWPSAHEPRNLTHMLHCISLLDYKLALPKYEVWQLSSRNLRIYVASSSERAVTKQRHITTCLWLRLCVGEVNKAVVAKQWQCYTSVCFRPSGSMLLCCYLEILAMLREAVRRRRPELWPDAWILHHDNAPAHDVLAVREFLAKKSINSTV
jgi:hypothetical protein